MKILELQWKGKTYKVPCEKIGGRLWYQWQGETFVYEPERRGKGSSQKQAEPGKIKAPMPGKIIKVLAVQGQTAEEQDALVVMEAMKMEYTLKADISGRVKTLSCSEGDQVALDQLLVEIVSE